MNEQWQELKETIIEMRDNDGTLTQQEVCKFLANLMDVLKKQMSSSENPNKWILVSERLPKTDGVYIVTRRLFDKQVDTEPYYMVDACYFDGSNTWHNDNRINHSRHLLEDIIAWMPLPQPYKAESED